MYIWTRVSDALYYLMIESNAPIRRTCRLPRAGSQHLKYAS